VLPITMRSISRSARECKNLVGGQSGPHHHLALKASVLYLLSHRLKMMLLCPRGGGIVVVADTEVSDAATTSVSYAWKE